MSRARTVRDPRVYTAEEIARGRETPALRSGDRRALIRDKLTDADRFFANCSLTKGVTT
jgi:hypothetical protein